MADGLVEVVGGEGFSSLAVRPHLYYRRHSLVATAYEALCLLRWSR